MSGSKGQGIVKWFNNKRGYGFIRQEGIVDDIFVYYSSIAMNGYKTLREREKVAYTLIKTEDGKLQAENVVVIGIPELEKQ
ncbi:MAG: cold shock domain-containing protein [Methanothrix sp.]|nr:cold shock domain-containing protein [Methanothrix sp.]